MSDYFADQVLDRFAQSEALRLTERDRAEILVGYGAIAILLGLEADEFIADLQSFVASDESYRPLVEQVISHMNS